MKILLLTVVLGLSLAFSAAAQQNDVWSNVPPASDDRFTNPKSKIYAGPNGWWNYGEVRTSPSSSYNYKGGFNEISGAFFITDSRKLFTVMLDFGTDQPVVGVYQLGKTPDQVKKIVRVSFADVSGNKIREWTGEAPSGTLEVGILNGFRYFKARGLSLKPTGLHNKGEADYTMSLGFEGAVKLEE